MLGGSAPSPIARKSNHKPAVSIATLKKEDKEYEKCRQLLKRATQEKKQGRIDLAIQSLRRAYEIDSDYGGVLTTKDYVRLPKYLQISGNYHECMNEMGRLTAYGTPLSKTSLSEFNAHLSDCYSAFAIIKKKQKINKHEIEADRTIASVYNLNSLHYRDQERRQKSISRDIEPDDGYVESIKLATGLLRKSTSDNEKLLGLVNAEIKSMPAKNIRVQEFYDCYSESTNGD